MRLARALLVALVACGGDRRPEARALSHYREGRDLLDQGEHASAARAFALAAQADPARPVLRSWQAYALAQGGEARGAIELLEGSVAVSSLSPRDRYNLAAWHVRLGELEPAAELLRLALEDDPELAGLLVDDPDLAPLRESSAFSGLLPREELRAVMLGEEGRILAGEIYDLELVVQGRVDELALLGERPLPDGFVFETVVDDLQDEGGTGRRLRSLRYGLRAAAAGEGLLGPWSLRSGSDVVELATVPWQTVLPPGVQLGDRDEVPPADERWWTPREALHGLVPHQAEHRHGRLLVVHAAGDQVTVQAESVLGRPLLLELRENDQALLLARAWAWAPGATEAQVTVQRGGATVLERVVERE